MQLLQINKKVSQRKIKLIYWKDIPNIGDLLSPYIISKLSNREIVYKRRWWGWNPYFKELWRIFIHRQWQDLTDLAHPFERIMLGVGSILKYANYNAVVWGSGFMNSNESTKTALKNIYAVRGCLSSNKIGEVKALGDPALLMPLLQPVTKAVKSFEVGIIPHWSEYDDFAIEYSQSLSVFKSQSQLINFKSTDIIGVMQQICSCKLILSSSLHGLILAHAYGIPALWIRKSDCGTDGFKFHDYFSSVQLPLYDGFKIILNTSNISDIHKLFYKNKELSLPDHDVIAKIQTKLLDSFPFK